MPDTSRLQFMAPDPTVPKPLEPAEDLKAMASIWMPIDIRQDQALAIGDVEAPPNSEGSSGPGSGGGIGTGTGTGGGAGGCRFSWACAGLTHCQDPPGHTAARVGGL